MASKTINPVDFDSAQPTLRTAAPYVHKGNCNLQKAERPLSATGLSSSPPFCNACAEPVEVGEWPKVEGVREVLLRQLSDISKSCFASQSSA